ncbi:MAG: DEAD/DEAH box helicase [Mycobacteriales bacterium]
MAELQELLQQLPPDALQRGRAFERICQWYLRNDPVYAQQLRNIWVWDEWPGRFGPDAGIDLVAETHDGGLWAIQAKAYGVRYSVTKADVDTFLSESGRAVFSYRLLIATTNQIGSRAGKTLDEQAIPAGVLRLHQLERALVNWPDNLDDLRARRPEPKHPFPHSKEAIDAVCSGFNQHDRGQLVMACGTGKTLVGLWVSERLGCRRTLVLVPSLSLLAQTLREWAGSAAKPFKSLVVCSDPSVEDDDLVEHTAELGVPTTTDPDAIVAALKRSGHHVVFSTYQSSPRLADACHRDSIVFDLAIADEAHRCAGLTGSTFATIVNSGAILADRRLFMTATPRYFTSKVKRLAEGTDLEIAAMDDEEYFGPVFHRLGFGEAISRGLLSDYRVAIVGVDDPACQAQVRRAALVTAGDLGITDARSLAGQIGLAKAMRTFDLRRVVSFHNRVSAARSFAQQMPTTVEWMPEDERPTGKLWAEHVSGAMPSGRRDTLLRRLGQLDAGARGLLSNARCLGEGVDVPAIDGVAFIDPRRSMIDITQAVGRAIRRSEEKLKGTIVLPVFVDVSCDPEEALDSSAFRAVWDVIRALRAHDEVLAESLDELRRQLGRARPGFLELPEKLHVDLPVTVGEAFARAFEVRLVEHTTATWEQWFGMVQTYVEREGHAAVPVDHMVGTWRLGLWVAIQRRLGREGALLADRRERLESLPGWSWTPSSEQWGLGFRALGAFVEREGHAVVPKRHVEVGVNLGTWVQHQRTNYRNGMIDAERVALIEGVPGWVWNTKDERWEQGFGVLRSFIATSGHVRVPSAHLEGAFPLGHWVLRQRQLYDRGELNSARQSRLEAVEGWVWDVHDERWGEALALLRAFAGSEGHARVPATCVVGEVRLGIWVANQRSAQKKGRLTPDRFRRLSQVPGWSWDALEGAWEENFEILSRFAAGVGTAEVPANRIEEGAQLGWWIRTQRKAFKEGTLTPERVKLLKSLPGWSWDSIETKWDEGFARLAVFAEREGQAFVPVDFIDAVGFRLGQWTAVQRRRHAMDKLDAKRIQRLESLPGWSWDMRAAKQELAMTVLRAFAAREGHAHVPVAHIEAGFPLGSWAADRRKAYRRGKLDEAVVKALDALPGWRW